ncbi:uncharacterized protein [Haliotis asinina]|uniref:uncharacterized protein n=1 Tax=Haliotis asinina TaxID=109174 RepID=UPI0035320D00
MYVLVVLIPAENQTRLVHTVTPVPSSGHYLQQYSINLARKSQYYLTLIVHRDVVDVLAQAVGDLNDSAVYTHDIESCSMKTFTKVFVTSEVLNLNSTVPFGLIVYSIKDDRASGREPGMLMDLTNCPTGEGFMYFPNDELCVKYEHREVTRQFASIYCHKAGGFLLDIKTNKMLQAIKGIYSKFDGTAFIGGFKYRYSDTFHIWLWSDCDPVKNWKATNSRTCMALHLRDMIWDARNCKTNSASICGFDIRHVSASGTIMKSRKKHGTRCKKSLPDIIGKLRITTGTSMLTSEETIQNDTVTVVSHHTGRASTGVTSASTVRDAGTGSHTSTLKQATSIHPSDSTTDTLMWTTETKTTSANVTDKASTHRTTKNIPSTSTTERTLPNTQTQHDDSPKPVLTTVQYAINHRASEQPRTLDMTVLMKKFLSSSNNSQTVVQEREKILRMFKKRSWRCNCFCRGNRLQNMSKEALQEHRARVKKELGVAKSSLRKTLSKKTCATDNRPSANAVGCFGFMFLIFPVAVIILSDINTLVIKHSTNSRKRKQAGCYINLSRNSLSSCNSGS